MPTKQTAPTFSQFALWVANRPDARELDQKPLARITNAARAARDEMLRSAGDVRSSHAPTKERYPRIEVLTLLAASSGDVGDKPPELLTARGFAVSLAYDEGVGAATGSICVLVRCPLDRVGQVQGMTAHLWNGAARYELGQFDADGKAIGILPAGVEISLADFAKGNVKLEEPDSPPDD